MSVTVQPTDEARAAVRDARAALNAAADAHTAAMCAYDEACYALAGVRPGDVLKATYITIGTEGDAVDGSVLVSHVTIRVADDTDATVSVIGRPLRDTPVRFAPAQVRVLSWARYTDQADVPKLPAGYTATGL